MHYTIKSPTGKVINSGSSRGELRQFVRSSHGSCKVGYYLLEMSDASLQEPLFFSLYKISRDWWEITAYFDRVDRHPQSMNFLSLTDLPGSKRIEQNDIGYIPQQLLPLLPHPLRERAQRIKDIVLSPPVASASSSSSSSRPADPLWPACFYDERGVLLENPRILANGDNVNCTQQDWEYAKSHRGRDEDGVPFVPNRPLQLALRLYQEKWSKYTFDSKADYQRWLEEFYVSEESFITEPFTFTSVFGRPSTLYVTQAELDRQLPLLITLTACEKVKGRVVTDRRTGQPFMPENKAFDAALLEFQKLPERYVQITFAEFYNRPFARISEQIHLGLSERARIKTEPKAVALPLEEERDFNFRCLILGEPRAGKSSLLRGFSTIDLECKTSVVELLGLTTSLSVYEIDEREPVGVISASQRIQPHGYFCCFDLTNRDSLQNLRPWIDQAKSYSDNPLPIVIVATKADLKQDISVTREEFQSFCREVDCPGIYTSSTVDLNMDLVFKMMSSSILSRSGLRFEIPPPKPVTVNQWASFFFAEAVKRLALDEVKSPYTLSSKWLEW